MQPVFEAFTNAIEAIKIKTQKIGKYDGEIVININAIETTTDLNEFNSLSITDNGIGFNEIEFRRFNKYKDYTKGFKNLGSGRIQFVHYFDNTIVKSNFEEEGKYFEREFVISKKKSFLNNNAIVFHRFCKPTEQKITGATVTFNTLIEDSQIYNQLSDQSLKVAILERYIQYFCYNKKTFPKIIIRFNVQSKLKSESQITIADIPDFDKNDKLVLHYSKVAPDAKSIIKSENKEDFYIEAFKVDGNILKENKLNLVSKGEIVEESNISLQNLAEKDIIKGKKYLFLLSSNYIDSRDSNVRGELNIPSLDSFTSNLNLFFKEEIVIEDIQNEVNTSIGKMYPEIEKAKEEHLNQYEKLREMFLLNDETSKDISISLNDTESKILEKFYESEAKKTAKIDATIKETIDRLNQLDTTSKDYDKKLKLEVKKLVKSIPQQNKIDLTHYVARRKLVLDLFEKILKRKLEIQKSKNKKFDEALIHNLLFQQGSNNPESSDLWIINEDFIYFKGSSEKQLSLLELDGKKVFKSNFTEEEERYLLSLGENRKIKRPDVLLFPEEGKCIIIEFKAPNVNASVHLTQIDRYANLILNYTEEEFKIRTFYGYLIGENIEPRDVLGFVSQYEHSYHFDYLFRPAVKVIGFDGRSNGEIYTEVLKYSTLLQRAQNRNKIFIEKLNKSTTR